MTQPQAQACLETRKLEEAGKYSAQECCKRARTCACQDRRLLSPRTRSEYFCYFGPVGHLLEQVNTIDREEGLSWGAEHLEVMLDLCTKRFGRRLKYDLRCPSGEGMYCSHFLRRIRKNSVSFLHGLSSCVCFITCLHFWHCSPSLLLLVAWPIFQERHLLLCQVLPV